MVAAQLRQLLFLALGDGSIYSALVPWVLDSDHKVCWELPKLGAGAAVQHHTLTILCNHLTPHNNRASVCQSMRSNGNACSRHSCLLDRSVHGTCSSVCCSLLLLSVSRHAASHEMPAHSQQQLTVMSSRQCTAHQASLD